MERKAEKEGGRGSKVSAWSASDLSVEVTSYHLMGSYRRQIRIFTLFTFNNLYFAARGLNLRIYK